MSELAAFVGGPLDGITAQVSSAVINAPIQTRIGDIVAVQYLRGVVDHRTVYTLSDEDAATWAHEADPRPFTDDEKAEAMRNAELRAYKLVRDIYDV